MIHTLKLAAAVVAAGAAGFPAAAASTGTGIQADPVCIGTAVQPGHSYPLSAYVTDTGSGSEAVTVTAAPETTGPAAQLHQVPASWLSPASADLAAGQGATVAFTLSVPAGAAPGAYWSRAEAGTPSVPAPGQAVLGAAATTAIVFTVGPSATPPPPCAALTLAQSTGKFPPWPSKAFATTSWAQVFARDGSDRAPDGPPTAGAAAPRSSAAPGSASEPAVAAAGAGHVSVNRDGWVTLALLALGVLLLVLKPWRRS